MDKDLKKYLESFKNALNKRFKSIDAKFDKIDARFDKVDERFDKVEQQIDDKIDSAVGELALIIAETVANPLQQHIEETRDYPTMRKDVALLKHDVGIIKQKLQLKT